MNLRPKLGSWRRMRGDARGVAAVEFALVIPIVILIYAGGFEVVQAATVYRKLTDTTVQMANVTSQYTSVAKSDISSIAGASSQIMAPYATSPLTVVMTEVGTDKNSAATVQWSKGYVNGSLTTGLAQNSSVTMPKNFASANSYYIMVQTTYSYTPTIGSAFVHPIPMVNQIFMVPRQSLQIPCKDCP